MKKAWILPLALAAALASCSGGTQMISSKVADSTATPQDDVSYAFGLALGKSLAPLGIDIDMASLDSGIKDALAKKTVRLSDTEVHTIIQQAIGQARAKMAADNKEKGLEFLSANAKKPGVKTTASGLQYQVLKEGKGAKPKATDKVKVAYVGTLLDGTTFDSSIERGEPAVFEVNQVIPGWAEAIQLMSVGSKYRVWIPENLAYGAQGAGQQVPPNSTLAFDIELLSIEAKASK